MGGADPLGPALSEAGQRVHAHFFRGGPSGMSRRLHTPYLGLLSRRGSGPVGHYSWAMNSTRPAASGEHPITPQTAGVSADHRGVDELFALLAYGEVAAFYRLTDEARMAPNLRGRINMASMAAAEMNHYELLREAMERRGVDVVPAMTKYSSALENYHRLTTPSTWLGHWSRRMSAMRSLRISTTRSPVRCPTRWPRWCAACWPRPGIRSSWSPRCAPR